MNPILWIKDAAVTYSLRLSADIPPFLEKFAASTACASVMPRYQLGIAIALAISAFCSAILFFWLSPPSGGTGKIQLPVSSDSDDEFEPELAGENDLYNVTKAEDFSDGTPIDAESFWAKVRIVMIPSLLRYGFMLY
jgi:hypothetical protein